MLTITVENVNHALPIAMMYMRDPSAYCEVRPRVGRPTREIKQPVSTVYISPRERVLFAPERDANPFFHLMESLWILAGCDDVQWIRHFLPGIADYSDDGMRFHGAYGARMRRGRAAGDQLDNVVRELLRDPESRRAVIGLWNPSEDSGYTGKDMPCNTTIYFKVRYNELRMTVCNRSNDVLWGAYGANVVQFSMLQELVAAHLRVRVGVYTQISDSFHVYTDNAVWERCKDLPLPIADPYEDTLAAVAIGCDSGRVMPYTLAAKPEEFDHELNAFIHLTRTLILNEMKCGIEADYKNPFFPEVAIPVFNAHMAYKLGDLDGAMEYAVQCQATD